MHVFFFLTLNALLQTITQHKKMLGFILIISRFEAVLLTNWSFTLHLSESVREQPDKA